MGHGAFTAPYQGDNSFWSKREVDTSITGTLFAGVRLWAGGEFYLNPEIAGGKGNSAVRGIAGFPIYEPHDQHLRVF
jgi:high affinity Mn2+ porin